MIVTSRIEIRIRAEAMTKRMNEDVGLAAQVQITTI